MSEHARPILLNLFQIRMAVGACTSILHRVAGVCLAISAPMAVYLLDLSLRGPHEFEQIGALFARLPVRAASVLLVWVLAHHLMAAVRHLLSDIDIGSRLGRARRSACVVNLGAIAVALWCAGQWL